MEKRYRTHSELYEEMKEFHLKVFGKDIIDNYPGQNKAVRNANIFAIKHTHQQWEIQWKTKQNF